MRLVRLPAAFAVAAISLSACGEQDAQRAEVQPADSPAAPVGVPAAPQPGAPAETPIEIQMINREGEQIGTARLTETGEGVSLAIQASGLPAGPRGIHFHETGQCEPPGFQSANAHFAPRAREHGLENPDGPHAGDMPNLVVRPDGSVDTTLVNPRVTLQTGQEHSLRNADGTALVIHAEQDDQRTDPSGNSGDRIACGVIGGQGAAATP